MNRSKTLRRRKFLKVAVTAAAAGAGVSCGGPASPYRFFTVAEAETASAVCERLIPADQDPGAGWAGTVNYIDRQLRKTFREFQQDYRLGLAAVDRMARALHGKRFVELPADRQTALLASLEKNQAPAGLWKGVEPKVFFELILAHTMQGYYGSPRHGGNRDAVSWKMLGIPDPPVRGRLHYDVTRS